jgi:ethanolamine utilization protein EutN
MILGKVTGQLWATKKDPKLEGAKFLIVQHYNSDLTPQDKFTVAVDSVGAGAGEFVLFAAGSSARQTDFTKDKPVDAVIMAIIDELKRDENIK